MAKTWRVSNGSFANSLFAAVLVFLVSVSAGLAQFEFAVPIRTQVDSFMFPDTWNAPDIGANALPVREDLAEPSVAIVEKCMRLYPNRLLARNLECVYVVGQLNFRGISAAGTNSRSRVFIVNKGTESGFTNKIVGMLFHTEFSSILRRNYPQFFDEAKWCAINARSFRYGTCGTDAVRNGESNWQLTNTEAEQGFVCQYAKASPEEDFNQIAGWLFVGEPRLWELARGYRRIGKKLQMTIDFYHAIDPCFTHEYFEKLERARH